MLVNRGAVLLVEDDSFIGRMITEVLVDAGYRVTRVPDGLTAIRVVDDVLRDSDLPCMILLDMGLPVVDGLGVLHHLAAHGDQIPVVAFSASSASLAMAKAAGVQAVLEKPFALAELLTVVGRVIQAQDGAA